MAEENLTVKLQDYARAAGADALYVVAPGPVAGFIEELGNYGPEREYLIQRLGNPQQHLAEVSAIVLVGINVFDNQAPSLWEKRGDRPAGRIARRYFYRRFNMKVARQVAAFLEELGHKTHCTENVPVKYLLSRAGVATYGKNGLIYIEPYGSWLNCWWAVLTNAPLLTLPLSYSQQTHCDSCDLCIRACPTGAIAAPYKLEDGRCLTRHNRGSSFIPPQVRAKMKNWVYGCDACQEICPQNNSVQPRAEAVEAHIDSDKEWQPPADSTAVPDLLYQLETVSEEHYLRNILITLGNWGGQEVIDSLEGFYRRTGNPVLKEYCSWAITQTKET